MTTRTIAVFDLDGTLTRRDTLLPFLLRECGGGPTSRAIVAQSLVIVRALLFGGSRDAAKERLLSRLVRGRDASALRATAEAFAEAVVARRVRPQLRERLEWHREAGHELVLVSASPELYVEPVARRLGFHAALATRLEVGPDGRLTGRLSGLNCRGAEKVARLRAWAGEGPFRLYAYGDSAGDHELLALADLAVLVGWRGLPPLPEPLPGTGPVAGAEPTNPQLPQPG